VSAAAEDHHDDHGHGGGSPFIQHHYDDAQHQFDSGKFGIWLFLAQEVLFFSALFVAYVLYRFHHPEIYGYAHKYLDVKMGAINTAVLIFSSLTAAWAVRAAQLRQKKLLIACLAATLACAFTFLVVKFFEYSHKYHEQILMGQYFDPCVSSGGGPLLTKSNACPGHQGSVYWFNEQPQIGCYPDLAIDQDPNKQGVQLDCSVSEAIVFPNLVEKKDKDGKVVKDAEGKATAEVQMDASRRWVFAESEVRKNLPQCPPLSMHEHPAHGAPPCWRYAPQPAVCRPGFYYTVRCAKDAPCAADKVPEFDTSARYGKELDCQLAFGDRRDELKKRVETYTKESAAAGVAYGVELGECRRSEAAGFIVEHHDHVVVDHEIRGLVEKTADAALTARGNPAKAADVMKALDSFGYMPKQLARATCKAPPPPAKIVGDQYAPPPTSTTLKTGEKSITTTAPVAHDDHEALYLGPPPEHTGMFFTIYFAMTGLHGIHVLVGVFVFIWLLIRAIKGHFTPEYFGPVDYAALYWHIVDLIWIFLFPLLYLIH
jgi:heme/copper-type cytochrome/quinol oxidase subunit 3